MRSTGTILYASDYNDIQRIEDDAYLITRSATPFEDLASVETEYEALVAALRKARPRAVLLDLRQARGRNDAGFEDTLAEHRRQMLAVTENTVILVRSAIGQLQVQRHMKSDGLDHVRVLRDEDEARRFLARSA